MKSVDKPLLVLAIAILALALRLAWVAYTGTEIPPVSDPQYYPATAANLADGRGGARQRSGRSSRPTAVI